MIVQGARRTTVVRSSKAQAKRAEKAAEELLQEEKAAAEKLEQSKAKAAKKKAKKAAK